MVINTPANTPKMANIVVKRGNLKGKILSAHLPATIPIIMAAAI